MKVLIVGLGLMGGAYAYRLSNKGYTVYGSDINIDSIDYALEKSFPDMKIPIYEMPPHLSLKYGKFSCCVGYIEKYEK